jgi:hypothetical protein
MGWDSWVRAQLSYGTVPAAAAGRAGNLRRGGPGALGPLLRAALARTRGSASAGGESGQGGARLLCRRACTSRRVGVSVSDARAPLDSLQFGKPLVSAQQTTKLEASHSKKKGIKACVSWAVACLLSDITSGAWGTPSEGAADMQLPSTDIGVTSVADAAEGRGEKGKMQGLLLHEALCRFAEHFVAQNLALLILTAVCAVSVLPSRFVWHACLCPRSRP